MSSQSFGMKSYMKGALLLTVAALIVKMLSAIYRVPYQNLVGDQGFYVYQQVYPFIAFFVVWTSSGFAVAISKILADMEAQGSSPVEKRAVTRVIFNYLLVLSIVFFCLLFFGANSLSALMQDTQLAPLLQVGSFVTLCMPILAVLKGNFQANSMMKPVAYAQVFEQMVRVAVILIGTVILLSFTQSVYEAGKMAIFGTVIGEVAGIILLLLYVKRNSTPKEHVKVNVKAWPIIKEVTIYSISISMSGLLLLCFQLVDSFTIYPSLIESGMEKEQAMALKGIYDRGQPLVQLGLVIASSLSLAIVPLVAFKAKKTSGRGALPFIQLTYRSSLLFGIAASLGLVVVMPYVNEMLFTTDALSNVLIIYVMQIIPLSIILTFTAILQGYSKLKLPAIFLVTSIAIKYVGNTFLIAQFGIVGAALASNIGLYLTAVALIIYLRKWTKAAFATGQFYWRLLLASIAMIVAVEGAILLLNQLVEGASFSRITAVLYSLLLVGVGAFTFMTVVAKLRVLAEKEWFLIPLGRRMAAYQLWLNRKK
ncbi:MAG: polysaccharide biosynthesis protein [Solibacillus sp.]